MTAPSRSHGFTVAQIERMCKRKQRYPEELTAVAAGMGYLEHAANKTRLLWTYRCKFCKGWHLTKLRQVNKQPITVFQRTPK